MKSNMNKRDFVSTFTAEVMLVDQFKNHTKTDKKALSNKDNTKFQWESFRFV